MAHVALINDDGVVQTVHVINNSDLPNDGEFSPEVEQAANDFQHALGLAGVWKLTSYNDNFRGRYAGAGFTYDSDADEFYPPKSYESWVWNGSEWEAPIAMPDDGDDYAWSEKREDWVLAP